MAAVRHPTTWSALGFEFILVEADPRRATVRASGALDLSARDSLVEVLSRQRDSGRVIVRLELTQVTFMDCSCLRALVEEHRRFLDARGQLVLTGVGPRVIRLLELTGLDQILFAVAGPPDFDDPELGTRFTPDPLTRWEEPSTTSFEVLKATAFAQSTAETQEPWKLPAPRDHA